MVVDTSAQDYWPGKQFGLPQRGARSTPTYLRRVLALGVDWALAMTISVFILNYGTLRAEGFLIALSSLNNLVLVGAFVVMSMLGGLVLAGSPGHLVCGIRIAPIKGGALGIVAPLVRPVLVALVLPALFVDPDMRGGHDRLVGTILVRR